jgi:hypothetical protein
MVENCPARMMGKSKAVLKNMFLLTGVTKQHIAITVITYRCLIAKAARR